MFMLMMKILSKILNQLIKNKNTQSIFSFYDSGRFYSFDNNINWRIQIWQDEIENTKDNF